MTPRTGSCWMHVRRVLTNYKTSHHSNLNGLPLSMAIIALSAGHLQFITLCLVMTLVSQEQTTGLVAMQWINSKMKSGQELWVFVWFVSMWNNLLTRHSTRMIVSMTGRMYPMMEFLARYLSIALHVGRMQDLNNERRCFQSLMNLGYLLLHAVTSLSCWIAIWFTAGNCESQRHQHHMLELIIFRAKYPLAILDHESTPIMPSS